MHPRGAAKSPPLRPRVPHPLAVKCGGSFTSGAHASLGSDRVCAGRAAGVAGGVSQLLVRNRIRELRANPQKLEVLRQELNERRKGADTHNLRDNILAVRVSPKEYAEARERQVRCRSSVPSSSSCPLSHTSQRSRWSHPPHYMYPRVGSWPSAGKPSCNASARRASGSTSGWRRWRGVRVKVEREAAALSMNQSAARPRRVLMAV
eukprot:2725055-Prymnesium_polylepis.1